jgi:hypothetical protein
MNSRLLHSSSRPWKPFPYDQEVILSGYLDRWLLPIPQQSDWAEANVGKPYSYLNSDIICIITKSNDIVLSLPT